MIVRTSLAPEKHNHHSYQLPPMAYLERIDQAPISFFFNTVLQCPISIESVRLIHDKVAPEGWNDFPKPGTSKESEPGAFLPLEAAFSKIIDEANNTLQNMNPNARKQQTAEMVYESSHTPVSLRTNSTRPDAYLQLVGKPKPSVPKAKASPDWANIVLTVELKKENNSTTLKNVSPSLISPLSLINNSQVVKKMVWNLNHIMRNDPARRFTLGLTIEDTQTRVWFTSRSGVMVSEPFDFFTVRSISTNRFIPLTTLLGS